MNIFNITDRDTFSVMPYETQESMQEISKLCSNDIDVLVMWNDASFSYLERINDLYQKELIYHRLVILQNLLNTIDTKRNRKRLVSFETVIKRYRLKRIESDENFKISTEYQIKIFKRMLSVYHYCIRRNREDFCAKDNEGIVHNSKCGLLKPNDSVINFKSADEAIRLGYRPCQVCIQEKRFPIMDNLSFFDIGAILQINYSIRQNKFNTTKERVPDKSLFLGGYSKTQINKLCRSYDMRCKFSTDRIDIFTKKGKWRIVFVYGDIVVYHWNYISRPWDEKEKKSYRYGYHQQKVKPKNIAEAIEYINKHDMRLSKDYLRI